MQDLPIGVDPDGADVWAWQDVLAVDVTVGAPPDEYITPWGRTGNCPRSCPTSCVPPAMHRSVRPFRRASAMPEGCASTMSWACFGSSGFPRGLTPVKGAYVRYPADELLAIVALESHRAGAPVVGEDLGTIEKGVPEQLAAHRMLSYRLLWFETESPSHYPEPALAAVTTHDLPTIAGLWNGADLRTQHALGLHLNEAGPQAIRARLQAMTGLPEKADVREVIVGAHQLLAEAPSMVVTATLEDALAVEERPNIPNTTAEWPNWALGLPVSLERLETHSLARQIGAVLGRRRRQWLDPRGR